MEVGRLQLLICQSSLEVATFRLTVPFGLGNLNRAANGCSRMKHGDEMDDQMIELRGRPDTSFQKHGEP